MLTSKFMRIISVLGIIALLTLQYFWLNNAYRMVERDMMEKCKGCLKEAIDEELPKRMGKNQPSKDVTNNTNLKNTIKSKAKVLSEFKINKSSDINIGVQDVLNKIGRPCSSKIVDSIFQKKIYKLYGFIPEHRLKIIEDSIKYLNIKNSNNKTDSIYQNNLCKVYNLIYGNTIYIKLDSKRSFQLILTSPTTSIIAKSKYIFIISILLVLLIGVILIFQLINMIKDKEFTKFMKDYTRILAHETRTPVNDIYMLTSILMSDDLVDPIKRKSYYNECLSQCSKLFLGIDNILLVAKAEQSKFMITKSTVDMRAFINKIADKYKSNNFPRKDLKIETSCDSEEYIANIDPDLMENVIFNLIENAIKYSKEALLINLSCSIENKHLVIKIKDNGIGISEKDIKHVFRIFERGEKIPSSQIKGFGIGLYYVYKVVKAHKGNVTVNSTEGVGSEFIIDIPNRFQ